MIIRLPYGILDYNTVQNSSVNRIVLATPWEQICQGTHTRMHQRTAEHTLFLSFIPHLIGLFVA
jgi:hypothetical protein